MAEEKVTCPQCGIEMKLRLGTYECAHCGTTLDAAQLAASKPQRGLHRREPWQASASLAQRPATGDPWMGAAEQPTENHEPLGRYSAPAEGMGIPASGSGVLPAYLSPPDSIYAVARAEVKVDKLHSEKASYLLIQLLLCLGPTVLYTTAMAKLDEVFPGLSNILISSMLISLVLTAGLLYLDYLWVKYLGTALMLLGIAASLIASVLALSNPFLRSVSLCYLLGIAFQVWLLTICLRDIRRLKMQEVLK